MPYGFHGKILRVNLIYNQIKTENLEELFFRQYLGGEGFVAYYLLNETERRMNPLGTENKLIFAESVIGAPISENERNNVGAKSPLTGGFCESEVGGLWEAELKFSTQ